MQVPALFLHAPLVCPPLLRKLVLNTLKAESIHLGQHWVGLSPSTASSTGAHPFNS